MNKYQVGDNLYTQGVLDNNEWVIGINDRSGNVVCANDIIGIIDKVDKTFYVATICITRDIETDLYSIHFACITEPPKITASQLIDRIENWLAEIYVIGNFNKNFEWFNCKFIRMLV